MSHQSQEFTFVNVTAGKKVNTRTIKRHVSNQTNRRKRQEAISQYQKSLLEAADQTTPHSTILSLPDQRSDKSYTISLVSEVGTSSSVSSIHEGEDEYQEFDPRPLTRRQPLVQYEGYWPTYQAWLQTHLRGPAPRNTTKTEGGGVRNLSSRTWTASLQSPSIVVVSLSRQHITIHIPRIDDPTEFSRIQWALKTCSDFIRSGYDTMWKHSWQEKRWYEASMLPLGVWRECFPLSVEFMQAGKMKEAFYILNAALSVTPAFFKQSHPGLLVAILGAMMYTCQIADQKLSTLIKTYITQLSMVHFGPKHPISMLLREQMRAGDIAAGRTDLLCIAVIDTFADCFGDRHYVPLSMRFGYVRRQLSSGEHDAALSSLDNLESIWSEANMPSSQLPKFLNFERAKVLLAKANAKKTNGSPKQISLQDLDRVADTSLQLPVFIPGQGPILVSMDSTVLKKLGKLLLFGSHYALALYIYTRIPELFKKRTDEDLFPALDGRPELLPDTIARLLIDQVEKDLTISSQEAISDTTT